MQTSKQNASKPKIRKSQTLSRKRRPLTRYQTVPRISRKKENRVCFARASELAVKLQDDVSVPTSIIKKHYTSEPSLLIRERIRERLR
jgi:hypothetical protein